MAGFAQKFHTQLRDKALVKKAIKQYFYILLGSFLIAAAFVLFITPYQIVPGGVYGTGVALNFIFPSIEVGTWGLMLDVPLLIIAFIFLGGNLGVKTIVAAVSLPIIMNLLTYYIGSDPLLMLGGKINLTDDVLLSCLFGGVIMGVGAAFIFKSHATSGGTDIIGMLFSKMMHIPIARAMLIVDSLVIVFGLIVIGDWKVPLYSLVTLFVGLKMVDLILEGGSSDKLVFILSSENEKIRTFILDDLSRGGTYIKSHGMYTRQDKEMIFVVITRREIVRMQDFVHSVDPLAFMVVVNAHETLGDGFKAFEKKVGG
ncbi:MAG: YitT family protein [Rikenellaceae bacterium]